MSKRKTSRVIKAGRLLKKAAPNSYKARVGINGRTHLPYGYFEIGKKKGK